MSITFTAQVQSMHRGENPGTVHILVDLNKGDNRPYLSAQNHVVLNTLVIGVPVEQAHLWMPGAEIVLSASPTGRQGENK